MVNKVLPAEDKFMPEIDKKPNKLRVIVHHSLITKNNIFAKV